MVPLSFASETFLATTDGALFWPEQKALLVADLHLEKASWFARLGQFLPPYDSQAKRSRFRVKARCFGQSSRRCSSPTCTSKRRVGSRGLGSSSRPMILQQLSPL